MAFYRSLFVWMHLVMGLILLVPSFATAQATGTISGLVTDSTDAALPSAALDVTNRTTGLVRRSTSTEDNRSPVTRGPIPTLDAQP
jgi:hypothetical protein